MEGGGRGKTSYKDAAMGVQGKERRGLMVEDLEGYISDDDVVKISADDSWVGVGMTNEEKREARRPWWNSLTIKLMTRSIGYHYLWKRLQAMWRTQTEPLLIDLGNKFYVVKLFGHKEFKRALSEGLWMIGDYYLHVQHWRPNF